jgi:hypothetical protein
MCKTYQIAHDDLAVLVGSGLGRDGLCARTACGLGVFLDTTNRSGRGWASSRAAGVGTTASTTALGLGDVVKRLVELARHCDVLFKKVRRKVEIKTEDKS